MISAIKDRMDDIVALCKEYKVASISLFGSAAKNKMTLDSDMDFLVRFSEDLKLLDYADNYFSLIEGLERITGRKVDLLTTKALKNPILKAEIDRSKIDLYAT